MWGQPPSAVRRAKLGTYRMQKPRSQEWGFFVCSRKTHVGTAALGCPAEQSSAVAVIPFEKKALSSEPFGAAKRARTCRETCFLFTDPRIAKSPSNNFFLFQPTVLWNNSPRSSREFECGGESALLFGKKKTSGGCQPFAQSAKDGPPAKVPTLFRKGRERRMGQPAADFVVVLVRGEAGPAPYLCDLLHSSAALC